jgi:predicted nucleotidyltransferase
MDPNAAESSTLRRIEELSAALRRVAEQGTPCGVLAIFLYGSALSRLFRPDSDLDVAILGSREHPLDRRGQAKLMDDLERATGRGVDLRLLRASSPSHQAHVLEQGLMVWTQDPGEVEGYSREILDTAHRAHERSELQWSQLLARLARTAAV